MRNQQIISFVMAMVATITSAAPITFEEKYSDVASIKAINGEITYTHNFTKDIEGDGSVSTISYDYKMENLISLEQELTEGDQVEFWTCFDDYCNLIQYDYSGGITLFVDGLKNDVMENLSVKPPSATITGLNIASVWSTADNTA